MNWREIPLTRSFVAIVDVDDYTELSQFSWHVVFSGAQANRPYARRTYALPKWGFEMMHRRLVPSAAQVDHINGNSLDNRRSNLRAASHAENQRNRQQLRADNTSGYRGVSWDQRMQMWRAQIQSTTGQRKNLGYYTTPEEAARVFDAAAVTIYGAFVGRLNFPDELEVT